MLEMFLVHVVPEIMLYRVDRHERAHHYVDWMFFHEVQGSAQPLLVATFQPGERFVTALVVVHGAEEACLEIHVAELAFQLLAQRGRMDKGAFFRRRVHAGNLKTVHRLGRVRERHVDHAHRVARVGQHPPERGRAA